jgi:signal transduction histidine kinase
MGALILDLPWQVWLPVVLIAVVPSAGALLILSARRTHLGMAGRLALQSVLVLALGFGAIGILASATFVRSGLAQLEERAQPTAVQLALTASQAYEPDRRLADVRALLSVHRAAHPEYLAEAVVLDQCTGTCIVIAAEGPMRASFLRQVTDRATRHALDGHLWRLGDTRAYGSTAPIRDSLGIAIATLVITTDAGPALREVADMSWVLLGIAVTLLAAAVFTYRRMFALGVSQRLRTLIGVLTSTLPTGPPASAPSNPDEIGELGEQVRAHMQRSIAALRERDSRYELLVEGSPDGILLVDDAGIVFANSAAERLLASPHPLPGQPLERFVQPRSRADVERGLTAHEEGMLQTGSGHALPVTVFRMPTSLHGRAATQVIIRDESERQALEATVRQTQKLDAVGRLTGGIAHDFNNLLTVILANGVMLEDSLTDPDMREEAAEVREAAQRARALVRKLLSFSRSEPLVRRQVLIGQLLGGATFLFRRTLPATLRLQVPAQLADLRVHVDPVLIEQVLLNLVTNARDAMEGQGIVEFSAGTRTVDAAYCAERGWGQPGEYAWIAVQDHGKGMDAATIGRAFEPFFTTKGPHEGAGLGLAMAYGILRSHGGYVEIDSTPSIGTCVTLLLPIAPTDGGPGSDSALDPMAAISSGRVPSQG